MSVQRLIPAREHRAKLKVANSRFITSIAPVFSAQEARSFVEKIKSEFKDASHNVPAFIIGHGKSVIEHCQDDGEPSGTAGRPMLAVLRGSGLGDAVVVVTRYFGGTKLGKGGLVRAYGDSVKAVIENLPMARKVATHTLMVAIPYNLFEQTRLLVKAHHGEIQDENFAADVTLTIQLQQVATVGFQDAISELTRGATRGEIVAEEENTIMGIIL